MNLKDIFKKIYNNEITENDVIVVSNDEEYDNYIFNDGFDYWDINGVKSLSFFRKDYESSYEIITMEEYHNILVKEKEKEKREKIKLLEKELEELKG